MTALQVILAVLVYSIVAGISMAIADNYCHDVVLSTLIAFVWPLCIPFAVAALAKNIVSRYIESRY